MAIVVRRKNGDLLWFDAVTKYGVSYSSTITKHPIATGGFVSDHTTKDNVVIQINAVLSDADFNINRPTSLGSLPNFDLGSVSTDGNGLYKPQQKQYTNSQQTVNPVQISQAGGLNRLLPEVIAQFTKDTIPTAVFDERTKAKFALSVKKDLISMWEDREEFQVLDMLDNFVIESFGPCILKDLSFNEDETTGSGIWPTMTIEQVTYTNLQEVSVKIKTSNKGRKSGEITTKAAETPPDNAPRTFTNQSSNSALKGR